MENLREALPFQKVQYTALEDGAEGQDMEQATMRRNPSRSRRLFTSCNIWALAVLISWAVLLYQNLGLFKLVHNSYSQGTYERGFATDLAPSKAAIQLQQIRYSNPIRTNENGTLHAVFNPNEPRYSGPPSHEVDKAWGTLMQGRYIRLEGAEISILQEQAPAQLMPLPYLKGAVDQSGVYTTIDMLHSLHCVNVFRMLIDKEHYASHFGSLPEQYRRMHLDHCVDQIRQAIMCHGDLTPVSLRPIMPEKISLGFVGETEYLHTCRNGNLLQQWVQKRGKQTGSTPRGEHLTQVE